MTFFLEGKKKVNDTIKTSLQTAQHTVISWYDETPLLQMSGPPGIFEVSPFTSLRAALQNCSLPASQEKALPLKGTGKVMTRFRVKTVSVGGNRGHKMS